MIAVPSLIKRDIVSVYLAFLACFATTLSQAQEHGVLREVWNNVKGSEIEQLLASPKYPDSPSFSRVIRTLSTPTNHGDFYGTRLRAYLTPSQTGDYTFWIVGDHKGVLYLSPDISASAAIEIASVPNSTKRSQWEKYPQQKSATQHLIAGQTYYIEVLHKESWGSDFVAVNWELPGAFPRQEIPIAELIPYDPENPLEPSEPNDPPTEPTDTLDVDAGADFETFLPRTEFSLAGSALSTNAPAESLDVSWIQISGLPSTLANSQTLTPTLTASTAGTRIYRLTVDDGVNTLSDEITVTVSPPLAANTGAFRQEIWLRVEGGSIDSLLNHPDFPDAPQLLRETTEPFGPRNWADNYGVRTQGLITPPSSDFYTFYVMGDHEAELYLSDSQSNTNATLIAFTPSPTNENAWTQFPAQKSSPVYLEKGSLYYVEILFAAGSGSDFHGIAWSSDDGPIQPLGKEFFVPTTPANSAPPLSDSVAAYPYAGPDQQHTAPANTVTLSGQATRVGSSSPSLQVTWTYLGSNPAVSIISPSSLDTTVSLDGAGAYDFRLSLTANGQTRFDDVSITILPKPTDTGNGLTRSVWLNIRGNTVKHLTNEDSLLENPHFEDTVSTAELPSNWTDNYGSRLIGFVHPPVTGQYRFAIAADDTAELRLSTNEDPENSQLIAQSTKSTPPRDWNRRGEQKSGLITLTAGEKYFIEALHKEGLRQDHLAIGWTGPSISEMQVIDNQYLSPAYLSRAMHPEIIIHIEGQKDLLWPESQISLKSLVYDQNEGPEALTYSWSSSPTGLTFTHPNRPNTDTSFPGPGDYTLTLTVSDGSHSVAESVTVSITPPVAPNTGSVTREVWLDLPGYLMVNLLADPRYPDSPDFVDTLPSFELPANWADHYGARVRAYLHPPETGNYRFYVSANEFAKVSIDLNGDNFENITEIIETGGPTKSKVWDQRSDQASTLIPLQKGKRYAIELLHREIQDGEHATLAWQLPNSEEISPISTAYVSPVSTAPPVSKNLIAAAPADIQLSWPENTADLLGKAVDQIYGPETLATRWEQIAGLGKASFSSSTALQTTVHLSQPGNYTIRLYASDGSEEIYDEMNIYVEGAISSETGGVTRSIYTDVAGDRVADLIVDPKFPAAPDEADTLFLLDSGSENSNRDQYGTLVTGLLTPPASGAYRFSVSGNDWVELWLSSDESPGNRRLVAFTPRSTGRYEWDLYPEYQTSDEIPLEQDQQYYLEIRHKESSSDDHFAVAWLRPDRTEMEIVQSAFLSNKDGSSSGPAPQINLIGNEQLSITVGDSFIEPGFQAFDLNGNDISSQVHVANSIDTETPGTYAIYYQVTNPQNGFAETVVRAVKVEIAESNQASYPANNYTPPTPVAWNEPNPDSISENEASRFLAQATFGPTKTDIARLQQIGYSAWIDEQLALEPSLHRSLMESIRHDIEELGYPPHPRERIATWWTRAVTAPDQLRQRVAFALSELLVVSDKEAFLDYAYETANYYDILVRNAFGDYEQLLFEVTLSPIMGEFLTMLRSEKSSPDENYARELLQLFTIGLVQLNPDGTSVTDEFGDPIPTYDNQLILELSRVFTGWSYASSTDFYFSPYAGTDRFSPMVPFSEFHDSGEKTLLGGFTLPQGLTPAADIKQALKHIVSHPNTAPFVSHFLIQRLTTSNPSPDYVYRVAQKFYDDSTGQSGNLGAVVKAILLDPEARDPDTYAAEDFGKLREPVIRLSHLMRSFEASTNSNPPISGRYPVSVTTATFAQAPLQAPSVFNFFEPNYAPPGIIAESGLIAPEFGITTEVTIVDTANFLSESINLSIPCLYLYSGYMPLDLSELISKAPDSDLLINELDTLLTSGSLSPETRDIIKTTLDAINDPVRRTKTALELIITSPEYAIQK
ncbi:conserved hypothetical protein [Verrucomicrobiia bacterium DG1235]|nr:conserved hypothetical protein [Verrucomicrobiae bacterium DG1235]